VYDPEISWAQDRHHRQRREGVMSGPSLLGLCLLLGACAAVSPAALAHTRSTCVHPPPPDAPIGPTWDFGLIVPKHPTQTLENPLRRNVQTPLVMLTFGDSAMWGNGLKPNYKYAHLAAQFVADGTGRAVHLITYSHSGANLTNTDSCYEPIIPADGGIPPGDLNAGLPTTAQQEASAAADKNHDYHDAELVLLNGCINDVSAEKIALPFPFSRETPDQIRELVHQRCSDDMLRLLHSTLADFRLATVIVSNYWLIISDKSRPLGLALAKKPANFTPQERATYRPVKDLLNAELEAEKKTGQPITKGHSAKMECQLEGVPQHERNVLRLGGCDGRRQADEAKRNRRVPVRCGSRRSAARHVGGSHVPRDGFAGPEVLIWRWPTEADLERAHPLCPAGSTLRAAREALQIPLRQRRGVGTAVHLPDRPNCAPERKRCHGVQGQHRRHLVGRLEPSDWLKVDILSNRIDAADRRL
jgi:hypothetical protein